LISRKYVLARWRKDQVEVTRDHVDEPMRSLKMYVEVAGLRTLVVNVCPATEHIIASVRSR